LDIDGGNAFEGLVCIYWERKVEERKFEERKFEERRSTIKSKD